MVENINQDSVVGSNPDEASDITLVNEAINEGSKVAPEWMGNSVDSKYSELSKFKSVNDLADAYLSIESKMGRPSGIPESPNDYKYDFPEEFQYDEKLEDKFRALAHEAGITQDQYSKFQDFAVSIATEVAETNQVESKQMGDDNREKMEQLEKEWGDNWDKNITNARKALKKFVGDNGVEWAESRGIDNDPVFLKLLSGMGNSMKEDTIREGESMMSTEAIRRKIASISGDKSHPYRDALHPGHDLAVKEVNDLYKKLHNTG